MARYTAETFPALLHPPRYVPSSFPFASIQLLLLLLLPASSPPTFGGRKHGERNIIPFLAPNHPTTTTTTLFLPLRPFLPRSSALVTLQPSCNPKTLRLVWFSTWYQPLALSPSLFLLPFLRPLRFTPAYFIPRSLSPSRHPSWRDVISLSVLVEFAR